MYDENDLDNFQLRYDLAAKRGDRVTQDAVIRALEWFASRPWTQTVPSWALALGIKPGAAALPPSASKPATWTALVDQFRGVNGGVPPTARSPKAWAAVDTIAGFGVANLIVGVNLSVARQLMALNVVWPLVLAADAIESSLSPGASETSDHVAWRGDLAAANVLVADIDGGTSTGATPRELVQRLAIARNNPTLTPGQSALARAISIPTEPALDSALISAADAVRLFF